MKKINHISKYFALRTGCVCADLRTSDSTLMGSRLIKRRFGLKKVSHWQWNSNPDNNWHLAFSVMPSAFPANPANGVSIRVNSQLGESAQAGTTGWRLVKLPGKNWSNWHNLDTTGLSAIPELLDSDSTWNLSAFTKGYTTRSITIYLGQL
jgi:hypothetical protein